MSELFVDRQPAALGPLPAGYHRLFARLLDVVEHDERIRALWLSGSLARGVADAGSDLDIILAVRDADFDTYAATWRDWLATVTPTLLARELSYAAGCFYSTTTECLRLDVVAEPVSGLGETPHRRRVVVLDRDGLDALVPEPKPRPGPDPARMAGLVEEFYRQLAIFPPAVVARADWLLGVVGVQGNRQMLYDLFVEANQPLPPMGVKQWSSKLTPEQRAALQALPPLDARPESLVAAMRATEQAWRTTGRATLEAAGGAWPAELADAATVYFEREVGRGPE
ncbi:aminoglycoside 6-adenylyltransferase [Actinopolymorpha alba]|uniref:aminoglycoside 6-adenylyltransferase n=1 Tax=Actinopolymorpha alba TaxID=533267 RepID=UPI00036090ED|nr:nucleotidyltransferase domain-containing protein [Actinopolymorpha alba]